MINRLWRYGLVVAYRVLLVHWFLFRPESRGVFIAVWHEGRLLIIRNSYRTWDALPAGGMKRHETPAQAARRELQEEVGIEAPVTSLRFVADIQSRFEYKRDVCSFFELTLEREPLVTIDEREVVWAGFMKPEDALSGHLAPPVRAYLESRRDPAAEKIISA